MTPYFSERYRIVVLGDNTYLWSGLRHYLNALSGVTPTMYWQKSLSSESLFLLRDALSQDASTIRWLAIAPHNRVREIQQILPSDKVCVLRDNLTLPQFAHYLRQPDFRRSAPKEVPLTRTEVNVCMLIIQGFSTAKIADMMHKSPKTIYTHRRNAMVKFHCHTLAELHSKMHFMTRRSFYQ